MVDLVVSSLACSTHSAEHMRRGKEHPNSKIEGAGIQGLGKHSPGSVHYPVHHLFVYSADQGIQMEETRPRTDAD